MKEQTELQKGIPANMDAERSVLGSCMLEPDAIYKIFDKLKPQDFFNQRHAWLWEAMLAIHDRHDPLDFVILLNELERMGKLKEIGGSAFLTDMIAVVPTSLYVDHYAGIVAHKATLRRLISVAGKIAELAYADDLPLSSIMEEAERLVIHCAGSTGGRDTRHIKEILPDVFDNMDAASRGERVGIPTKFDMLDRVLGGLQRSDLIILAGRPGMGKSGFSLTIVANIVKMAGRCLIFSLEMSAEQCAIRLLSMETGIDAQRLRLGKATEGEEANSLFVVADQLSKSTLYINDTPSIGISELRREARRVYTEHGLDLIVIDYLQLVTVDGTKAGMNREQEISYLSRTLKGLARELNVPVLALSQLSRAVESRSDKRPMLSDLRESGSLEQDADVVMFVYRDDYYNEDSDQQNIAEILIPKHRHGPTGTVQLYFRKELTQFRDLEIQIEDIDYPPPTY